MSTLRIFDIPPGSMPSAAAARLAARHAARMLGHPSQAVRIAHQQPSGRPVILIDGHPAKPSVSIAHIDRRCAIAIDAGRSIGVDLVRLADAQRLAAWLHPDDAGACIAPADMPAYCWAAREAAYKATRQDIPFAPDDIGLSGLTRNRFYWCYRSGRSVMSGGGRFDLQDSLVCALAWADQGLSRHKEHAE